MEVAVVSTVHYFLLKAKTKKMAQDVFLMLLSVFVAIFLYNWALILFA